MGSCMSCNGGLDLGKNTYGYSITNTYAMRLKLQWHLGIDDT